MLLFVALLVNATLRAVLAGRRPHLPEQAPRQQAGARRGVLPRARRDPRARQGGRREQQVQGRLQVPAGLPRRARSTPTSPATSPATGGSAASSPARTRSSPAATRRLFVNRVIDLVDNAAPQGGSVTLTINPAAQQAAYDGLKALGDNVPRRGRRDRADAPARSSRWSPARPTTPTGWPATTSCAVGKTKQRLENDEPEPAGQPRHRGGRCRRVRPSSWSPPPPRSTPGSTPPTPRSPAGRPRPAADHQDLVNENNSACGGDQITLTQALAGVLQRLLRLGRPEDR